VKAAALALLLAVVLAGCERGRGDPPEPGALPEAPGPSSFENEVEAPASAATAKIAPEVASALVAIHDRRLAISAPVAPSQRLAFGKGMLGELSGDRLLVRSTTRAGEPVRIEVPRSRALTALPSGALVAVGSEAVYRLDPGSKKARVFKRMVFFPDSELLPERADDRFFWTVQRSSKTALKYALETTELSMLLGAAETALEAFDGRAIAMSRDGVFIYSTGSGIGRLVPRGKLTPIERPKDSSGLPIWRLVPAVRLDRVWVVAENGEVELWPLRPKASVLRRFRLTPPPYEVAAGSGVLAVLALTQGGGKPRSFALQVYDEQGVERFRHDLPADPATAGEDWLESVTRNKNLALSEAEDKVAVGGPGWLGAWDLQSGEPLELR
jgi:hypothetical protein